MPDNAVRQAPDHGLPEPEQITLLLYRSSRANLKRLHSFESFRRVRLDASPTLFPKINKEADQERSASFIAAPITAIDTVIHGEVL
jgi:hypothetical protein